MIKAGKKERKNKVIGSKLLKRMVFCCMIATVISGIVFLLSYQILTGYMRKKSEDPRTRELQKQQIAYELQAYIARHNLSITDVKEIKRWQSDTNVTVEVVGTPEIIASQQALLEEYRGSVITDLGSSLETEMGNLYEIRFKDHSVMCKLFLKKDHNYEKMCLWISLVTALIVYGTVFLLLIRPRLRYILQLKNDIEQLTGQNLINEITVQGKDELAEIGRNMNLVRQNVIGRIQDEREAITANQELITAMSHDLRTPLTRQIGYLEILSRKKYQGQQELEEYIEKAKSNAFIMKNTTDKLFRYFLAFGKPEAAETQIEVDGKPLFNSVIKEQVAYIVSQGFVVSFEEVTQSFQLKIDSDEFARVFDNIFHNLKKYGDVNVPVYISCVLQDNEFLLMVQNGIKKDTTNVESTKVGLKIVERIMKSMDGSLEVMNDGQYFIIQLVFKVVSHLS